MSNLNSEFLQAYEKLKSVINSIAKQSSHSMELARAAKNDNRIQRKFEELDYIRDVRHRLCHPKGTFGSDAFLITPEFLSSVEKLTSYLAKNLTAKDMGIGRKELFTASADDHVKQISFTMRDKKYSHVPILDKNNILIGVFNEASVFDFYLHESVIGLEEGTQISELLKYCDIERDRTEGFIFANPNRSLNDIVSDFTRWEHDATRLGAIFITPSGKEHEPIQRMMTAWDALSSLEDGQL